jgi:hypothetical protein
MPLVAAIVGLLFPRLTLVILYFLTDWFRGVFDALFWPIIGFILMPVTLLWYLAVHNYFGGAWDTIPVIGMIVAVVIDLGLWKSSKKSA